jgi:hypothetical protein
MADRYDQVLTEWSRLVFDINGVPNGQQLNCPDVADKLSDFLRTGVRMLAGQGTRFRITGRFTTAPRFHDVVGHLQRGGHGTHVVVHGVRSGRRVGHYFVAANIRGVVYVLDAQLDGSPITDWAGHIAGQGFVSFRYSSNFNSNPAP